MNGVESCPGVETGETGDVTVGTQVYNGNAWDAIVNDMTTGTNACLGHH